MTCDILSKIIFMQRWETFVFCVKISFISIFSCDWIWNYLTDWTETSLILPDCDLILWPVKCATFYINLKEWQMRFVINKKNNLFDLGHCDLLFLLSSNLNDMFILSIYLLLHKIKGQKNWSLHHFVTEQLFQVSPWTSLMSPIAFCFNVDDNFFWWKCWLTEFWHQLIINA